MPVGIHVFLRDKLRTAAFHGFQGHLGKDFHLQEPLGAQLGLNHGVRALGIAHRRGVVFHFHQIAGFFQHLHNLLAGHKTVLAHQNLGFLVQFTVVVDDFQHGQVVPEANLVVVHVVCGGYLEAAGTEVHLHVIVLNHGNLAVDERDEHFLALEPEVALVLGIHADGGVRHDGFRTGGGNDQVLVRGLAVAVGNEVFQVIKMALGVLVDDFVVTHGSKGLRVPVHHAHAFVNPAFLIKIDKGVDYGLAQRGLHGEAGAVPVAGAAQFAQLFQNDAAMLFLPLPGVLKEFLPADILLGNAHGLEFGHHLALRSDGSVVRTGDPAGILPVHAGLADENVVERIVEHVSHVQDTCHIGRRNHDGIRFLPVGFAVEKFVFQPVAVPLVFNLRSTVFGG